VVARGAAYADINNDGAPDILMTTNGGPAYLFENTGAHENALRIKAVGTRSNRDGIGAIVRVDVAGRTAWQTVHSGSSYCSQSELTLTFGLGKAAQAESVEFTWTSGQKDTLHNLKSGATYTVEEGGKILATKPFRK
jgi:hypothetical protein